MLYLGKWTEKSHSHSSSRKHRNRVFYSLSATWIILGIFSKPAQRIAGISVALTAKCSMWTGMDGILAAARGRGDAFPAAPGLAPLVLGSGSMVVLWSPRTEHPSHRPAPSSAVILCAQQHQGAFLGSGKVVSSSFSDKMQIFKWAKTFPAGPALWGAAQAAGWLTWLESHSRDPCVSRSFFLALC